MAATSSWLVRLQPFHQESASSWRQRLAWANGYRLFPIPDDRRRRCDPDIHITDDELRWLEDLTLQPRRAILDLFIANKSSMHALVARASRHIPWVVHSKPVSGIPHGSMFCPACLQTDQVPYFRWTWRLGFMNACIDHQILMLDSCPNCKTPPWPCGSGVKSKIHPNFVTFLSCWNCGFNLGRCDPTPVADVGYLSELHLIAMSETVMVGDVTATSAEALETLRAIGHIFLRNKLRYRIGVSASQLAPVARALSKELSSIKMIEHASSKDRSSIVMAAKQLMMDWPNQFIEFCDTAQITRADFYATERLMPWWMNECINTRLSKHNRNVRPEDVMQAIASLTTAEGTRPTKAQIKRHLGWYGEKALRDVYAKRSEATFDEWQMFCDSVRHHLVLSTHRIDCRAGLLRDLMVIAQCARENTSTKDIASLPRETLWTSLHWKDIEDAAVLHWGITAQELHSKVYNSAVEVDLQRLIRTRLRVLMRDLPFDLLRNPGVFRRFLFESDSKQPDETSIVGMSSSPNGVSSQLDLPF